MDICRFPSGIKIIWEKIKKAFDKNKHANEGQDHRLFYDIFAEHKKENENQKEQDKDFISTPVLVKE
jgi:hypothetical protein